MLVLLRTTKIGEIVNQGYCSFNIAIAQPSKSYHLMHEMHATHHPPLGQPIYTAQGDQGSTQK